MHVCRHVYKGDGRIYCVRASPHFHEQKNTTYTDTHKLTYHTALQPLNGQINSMTIKGL